VLALAQASGRPLEALAEWPRFPQVLVNVRVRRRAALEELPALSAEVRELERRLGRDGRVFIRYSGTEPLLRILVEAPNAETARQAADHLAALARRDLGAA
jgi:phosphoglucosamine mutase